MVAKSGDRLLREEAISSICNELIPLAKVVTPNIPEAEDLTGLSISTDSDVREAAQAIIGMGAQSVVVKGGHRDGPPTDILYDGETVPGIYDRADPVHQHPRDGVHFRVRRCCGPGSRPGNP